MLKAYLSGVFPPAPVAWQEPILASAVPGWPEAVQIFRDPGRNPAMRAALLRSIVELDMIYLASLTALGVDQQDVEATVKSILQHGGTLIAVTEGLTVARLSELDELIANWKTARKRQRIANAQKTGGIISAQIKKSKADEGVARIKLYWGMSQDEWPTEKLRRMAGTDGAPMSYNTIVAHIGYGRKVARMKYLKETTATSCDRKCENV